MEQKFGMDTIQEQEGVLGNFSPCRFGETGVSCTLGVVCEHCILGKRSPMCKHCTSFCPEHCICVKLYGAPAIHKSAKLVERDKGLRSSNFMDEENKVAPAEETKPELPETPVENPDPQV